MRKFSWAVARGNGVPTVAQRRWCGGGKGAAALEILGNAGARVRVQMVGAALCRVVAVPLTRGPEEGSSPGISGRCAQGRRRRGRRKR
jgi:hypothetical protein